MIDLDEQLQRLAASVNPPATTPEADLARGLARLRHRNLGAAGAALATAAVIGTSVVLLSGGSGHPAPGTDFAGGPSSPGVGRPTSSAGSDPKDDANLPTDSRREAQVLRSYRDVLREDLDPAGTRIQTGPITNRQTAADALGTKLDWNGGGMLQVVVGSSLEGVQFFCDHGCTQQSVAGASKALVLSSPGRISVAVFQDDGDIVALTADTSFGNNGTSTAALGLTVDQLLTAAADPRLDLPEQADQSADEVGTQ